MFFDGLFILNALVRGASVNLDLFHAADVVLTAEKGSDAFQVNVNHSPLNLYVILFSVITTLRTFQILLICCLFVFMDLINVVEPLYSNEKEQLQEQFSV